MLVITAILYSNSSLLLKQVQILNLWVCMRVHVCVCVNVPVTERD